MEPTGKFTIKTTGMHMKTYDCDRKVENKYQTEQTTKSRHTNTDQNRNFPAMQYPSTASTIYETRTGPRYENHMTICQIILTFPLNCHLIADSFIKLVSNLHFRVMMTMIQWFKDVPPPQKN
jgi:hypothetical protein